MADWQSSGVRTVQCSTIGRHLRHRDRKSQSNHSHQCRVATHMFSSPSTSMIKHQAQHMRQHKLQFSQFNHPRNCQCTRLRMMVILLKRLNQISPCLNHNSHKLIYQRIIIQLSLNKCQCRNQSFRTRSVGREMLVELPPPSLKESHWRSFK